MQSATIANKAATTSIANYCDQHPDVFVSAVKEPMFFSSNPVAKPASRRDANLENDLDNLNLLLSLMVAQDVESWDLPQLREQAEAVVDYRGGRM